MLASACGGRHDAVAVDPADAAALVASTYGLSPQDEACLEDGFGDDAGAAEALSVEVVPDRAQLEALARVLQRCLPTEALAATVAAAAGRGLGDRNAERQACLAGAIVELPPAERDLLFAGLVSPAVVAGTEGLALELRALTGRLLRSCGVSGSVSTGETPTATTTAGDPGAVPEEPSG